MRAGYLRENVSLDQLVEQDALLSTWQVAQLLCVSVSAVRMWRFRGQITPVKIGKAIRYRAREIKRIIDKGLDLSK